MDVWRSIFIQFECVQIIGRISKMFRGFVLGLKGCAWYLKKYMTSIGFFLVLLDFPKVGAPKKKKNWTSLSIANPPLHGLF